MWWLMVELMLWKLLGAQISHKSSYLEATMHSPLIKKRKSMKAEGYGERAGRKRRNAHSPRTDDEDGSCTH